MTSTAGMIVCAGAVLAGYVGFWLGYSAVAFLHRSKFLETTKDGGAESTVWAHWLIEIKCLFSVALLRFEDGTRDAYHSHAFNSVSWVLRGRLLEEHADRKASARLNDWKEWTDVHTMSLLPVITRRSTYHRVRSVGRTWVLTFRGPWSKTWREAVPDGQGGYAERTLTHGRKEVRA